MRLNEEGFREELISHHRTIQKILAAASEAAEEWSGRHVLIYKCVASSMCVCQQFLNKTTLSKTNTFWANRYKTQGLYGVCGMGLIRSLFCSSQMFTLGGQLCGLHILSFSKVGHMDGIINLSLLTDRLECLSKTLAASFQALRLQKNFFPTSKLDGWVLELRGLQQHEALHWLPQVDKLQQNGRDCYNKTLADENCH